MTRTALLLLPTILCSCMVVRGNGHMATEEREVGPFSDLSSNSFIDLSFVQGDAYSLALSCDENLLDVITTEVEGDELVIETEPGVVAQSRQRCLAEVTGPALYQVHNTGSGDAEVSGELAELCTVTNSGSGELTVLADLAPLCNLHNTGSGDLRVDGINTSQLNLSNTGSGRVQVEGLAGHVDLASTGSGDVDGLGLAASTANITNTGSGEVSLTVEGEVNVALSGSGDVVLGGSPAIGAMDVSGSGEVQWN